MQVFGPLILEDGRVSVRSAALRALYVWAVYGFGFWWLMDPKGQYYGAVIGGVYFLVQMTWAVLKNRWWRKKRDAQGASAAPPTSGS